MVWGGFGLPFPMLVIVGHGPSAERIDGDWLDQQTVVRLKNSKVKPGTRTDYLCARQVNYRKKAKKWNGSIPPFWIFIRDHENPPMTKGMEKANHKMWSRRYRDFEAKILPPGNHKPSTGLCAIMCAIEFLEPEEIGLTGFDAFFHEDFMHPHNMRAEREFAATLPVSLIEL